MNGPDVVDVVEDVVDVEGAREGRALDEALLAAATWRRAFAARRAPVVVTLEGEIGRAEGESFVGQLRQLLDDGQVRVVVDLEEVRHFDFRGVRPLARVAEEFRALGGDVKLAGLSTYLHAIVRSAGAHDAFDCFAQADEALAAFGREDARAQG